MKEMSSLEKNKQTVMFDKQDGQTRLRTNNLSDKLICGRSWSDDKGWCIIVPIQRYSSYRYLQLKKKCCNHWWPDSVFSSPEHNVMRVSYCNRSMSGIRPSLCPSVHLSGRTNESVLKWLGLGWVRVSFPLVYIIVT